MTMMMASQVQAQDNLNWNMITVKYLAKDSALSNSNTKISGAISLLVKNSQGTKSINYQHGAHVLVMGKQTNDSVHALIYVNTGIITGGTRATSFQRILVDSLTLTKNVVNLNLAVYLDYPELTIEVAGAAAGNGNGAKWSALFGGTGFIVLGNSP
jgi:hypothetical protein